jgi:hypothetical protein
MTWSEVTGCCYQEILLNLLDQWLFWDTNPVLQDGFS